MMGIQNSFPHKTHFIDAAITVTYTENPLLEKKPKCPDGFIWDKSSFQISRMQQEWVDFARRGKMARNMSEVHSSSAVVKGSWGVGRFFFRVETTDRRIFDIYYDRAPKGSANRKGQWFLFRELVNDL